MTTKHSFWALSWQVFCAIWVVATAAILYHFTFGNYGEFDPQQRWLDAQPSLTLSALDLPPQQGLTLVHVRRSFCSCNPLADNHRDSVPDQVEQHQLDITRVEAAGFSMPASPAALIFDGDELIYAGPYASGALCSVENSLIEDILVGQQRLAGPFLNGLVKACRCLS
ncbi:DUF6436 domain-containing protein [Aliidiomarina soli]|uniref:DUF6436 domain-containing protein n=1 Tax=Aliidiomarina soli TaxID=1928574 RepID=A0A432WI21_9GAMM|nr:DUF6436 domain-containing protein [Aliidiomarina soli]RUO33329.1 hypothetical protein CWE14_08945 [Aliidiomarina soli]